MKEGSHEIRERKKNKQTIVWSDYEAETLIRATGKRASGNYVIGRFPLTLYLQFSFLPLL